jgi:predicted ATPase/DNA-binding winged helix-turn-helix (wHTH) protein
MEQKRQITFGSFRLDEADECLWHGSQALALRPKVFAVLKRLLDQPGRLVTKQQLLDAVWPDTYVTDAVLKDSIRELREALGDDAKSPQFIETAHRRGYRFIGQITEDVTAQKSSHDAGSDGHRSRLPDSNTITHPQLFIPPASTASVVGRETAIAQMRGWLEKALAAERQTIFVIGEAGIGKTTLVEAFLRETAQSLDIRVGRGQCLEQYGGGEVYLPVLEAISRLAREPGGARVREVLSTHAPTWLAQMPSLIPATDREALRQQMLGATRERMLREMADAIEALTAETPLVLVLEDLHWSDYSTLDLVSYLARRREAARLMVIGTYRPVDVILSEHPLKGVKQELQMRRLCHELPVEYLTEATVAEYLSARFPRHLFRGKLAGLIHRRTEGNPLFMVNVVDYLLDDKIIAEHEGQWQLQADPARVELEVPENIRHLIEKQIERLSHEEQQVLEAASVVGLECSAVAIAAALERDVLEVEERCEELARRDQFISPSRLVELPDGTLTPRHKFIHVLYMDVLYSRVAVTRRAQMHRRIGESGEAIYGERVGEIAAELAVHFEQGRDAHRAVKYLQLAAENAARRCADHEAEALARRRLGLLRRLSQHSD